MTEGIEEMKFGPAEMAQMMEAAKALIAIMIVYGVGIGIVLGLIVALCRRFSVGSSSALLSARISENGIADIKVDPTLRLQPSPTFSRARALLVILLIGIIGGGLFWYYPSLRSEFEAAYKNIPQRPDASQRSHTPQRPHDTEIYSTLGIPSLPEEVAASGPIRRPIEQLSRERCDREAIFKLGDALRAAGYRREAAKVHVSFSEMCGGHWPSLWTAASILLDLSDHNGAATVAAELINLEPLDHVGYYLRALARDGSGLAEEAIDDYVTTIELVGDKDRIFSTPYFNMARLYEKLGRFCDAVLAIEAWVSLNPRHDTGQTRKIIATYMAKGRCATAASGSPEVFAVSRPNDVVNLPVTINGARGIFILDTGATFVSLKNTFAQKAKVRIDPDSIVRLHTANGITTGKRGRARRSNCVRFRQRMSQSSFRTMPRAPMGRASMVCSE